MSPTERKAMIRKDRTDLSPKLASASGQIYSGKTQPLSHDQRDTRPALQYLADAAARTKACDIAAQIAHEGKISHSHIGISIHNALFADLVDV